MERGFGGKFPWLQNPCCQPPLALASLITASGIGLYLVSVYVPHGTIPVKQAPADVTGV